MALTNRSTFLYGFEVTANNRSIDFKSAALGPEKQATLTLGFYSLTSLMAEIKRAMEAADPLNTYTVTANRNFVGGTENRVTITTSGLFLSLLFLTGTRTSSTTAPLIGFAVADQTGLLTYTGTLSAGTIIVSELEGYTYVPIEMNKKVQGTVTISAGGEKEAVVWQVQQFIDVEFKYEPEAKVLTEWQDFIDWAIQQKAFEFTPSIASPNSVVEVTLETTDADGKGLGWKWKEMLPQFPFFYRTGNIKLRKRITSSAFI